MDYGSEEGYQLFGPTNSPDKTQQFLDQASRQQDQNSANSRWLAEEQLQNTRNAGAGIMHGIDQGFSQYNTANDRADRNQQRGIENKRADINQGMDQTRLGMDQKSRVLADAGMETNNATQKINLDQMTREQAFQNGVDPVSGKSRYDTMQGAKYDEEGKLYGPQGRNQQTFDLDQAKGRAQIGMDNANAGNLATQRAQNKTLFDQGQEGYKVDMLARDIGAARAKGDQRLEAQVLADAKNTQGLQPSQIAAAQAKVASKTRETMETNDIVEMNKPGVKDLLTNAQQTREKLAVLSDASHQAHNFQSQKVGSPEESAAKENLVGHLRSIGKHQEADLIEDGGANSLRLPGGSSLSTKGMQTEGERVRAVLTNMQTEVEGQIHQLELRARSTNSPTALREIDSLKADLAQIQAQNASNHSGDQAPNLLGGGHGLSNASMFQPPQQLPGAQGAQMAPAAPLPISFSAGQQPNAYGKPAARPSLRQGGMQ